MFVSSGQFFVAIFLFGLGYFFGIFYNFISLLLSVNNKILRILKPIVNTLCFVGLSFLYFKLNYELNFPSFRLYMPISVLLGIVVEGKTFHIILAKFIQKVYNIYRKNKVNYDGRKN